MDSTLAKGLAALEWMARRQKDCRVIDLAEALGIGRSNAHRTLQTLVACGWVVQDAGTSSYRPSMKLFELGAAVSSVTQLTTLLRPHLAVLAERTGETIHLTTLDGAEVVYLDKIDSPQPVAAYSRIGGRAAACCVASGKALLAALNDDDAALRARLGRLVAHTPHSHTGIAALQADLARTRERGFAQNHEEWRLGVCGLGAPIFDARNEAVAAVGMSVPSIRFSRDRARTLANQLLVTAREASRALGHQADALYRRPADSVRDRIQPVR